MASEIMERRHGKVEILIVNIILKNQMVEIGLTERFLWAEGEFIRICVNVEQLGLIAK